MTKKEKKFIRVCVSLDEKTIKLLEELSDKHNMSKSEFIKYLIFRYQNTYGFRTEWLKGTKF